MALGIPLMQMAGGLVATPEELARQAALERELGVGHVDSGASPDILVQRQTGGADVNADGPAPPFMGNRQYLEEAAAANNAQLPADVTDQRRGLFGVRGGLRDLLGTLGDALVTANGGEATYAPRRERERLADAMVGYTNSPEAAMAAVERVTQIDPVAGRELLDQLRNDELRRAQIDNTRYGTDVRQANNQATQANKLRQAIANVLSTPGAFANGLIDAPAYQVIAGMAGSMGLTPEDFGITDLMTEEAGRNFAGSNYTPQARRAGDQRDTQLEINQGQLSVSQQNANSNAIRANRAPPPRTPRAETSDERYIRLGDIPLNQMSPGEAQWYRQEAARREGGNSPRRGGAVSATPPAATTNRFRIVGTRPAGN